MTDQSAETALRVGFVPGVTVRKWTRAWVERHPLLPLDVRPVDQAEALAGLREGRLSLAFVRLPVERDGLSVIRLYGEVPVLVLPRDHEWGGRSSLTADEVAGLPAVAEVAADGRVKDAVELVAAGVGSLRLPHSLARLHARKDVVAVPISDGIETDIAIAWSAEATTPEIEEFVGIVRGRTAGSSRSTLAAPAEASTATRGSGAGAVPKRARPSTTPRPRAHQQRSRRRGKH
ncbi:LysR substrate-binding domain-containing protein [Galbitalea soli]|uniref:LysR family transcriptional regulator n=1 Tax=Galbitalea soli TaxID=1268042 RepID=A0A7C9TN31_9MICO|nr:LysR family transcriptional regulator [Galbitalea soli]NYJ30824.1 DNA-binding transcriptional LysR family regulator [Galbitalea soli]